MSKDLNNMRTMMNEVKIISESYLFPDKNTERTIKKEMEIETPEDEMMDNNVESVDVNSKIEEIRKIAISLISELSPATDPENYKVAKTIWDSCDKVLTKGIANQNKQVGLDIPKEDEFINNNEI